MRIRFAFGGFLCNNVWDAFYFAFDVYSIPLSVYFDGRLRSGDMLLRIGAVSVVGMCARQAAAVLRQCGACVRLLVARPAPSPALAQQRDETHREGKRVLNPEEWLLI
ncbi:Patj homolog [Eumeta japonica]|uniref:Patj homolog n=1 Tax=Eumeta variegata TaxID=151549 RepID=A0A4C1XE55_EUMVA|nr:Patj homolog [Eumeta japonica]